MPKDFSYSPAERAKPINGLTPNKLRKYKGLENLSEEQALQAISGIEKLCVLLYQAVKNSEIITHENESGSS